MMKILLFVALIAQIVLFYVVFLSGIVVDPFHQQWMVTHPSAYETRFFNPSGLLLTLIAFGLVLLLETVLRRTRPHAVITTIAFVIAVLLGFVGHFGFITIPR